MFRLNLKKLRESYKMSQVELAEKLNVQKATVSNWENGYINPSINKLVEIADIFQVSIDFLLDRDNREYLDVTGLTVEELAPIRQIISDLKKRKS